MKVDDRLMLSSRDIIPCTRSSRALRALIRRRAARNYFVEEGKRNEKSITVPQTLGRDDVAAYRLWRPRRGAGGSGTGGHRQYSRHSQGPERRRRQRRT